MKRFLCASAILFLPLLLGSCSSNSAGGYTIGKHGSAAWHSTAPRADINAFFDRKSLVELCNYWAANYPDGRVMWQENRTEIGYALQRKGKDPMYCANPQADETSVQRARARRAEAAARRAEAEAKRVCEEAKRAYRRCRARENYSYYTSCSSKPRC